MKNSMEIPQKVTIELPYDPVILLLSIYPEKMGFLERLMEKAMATHSSTLAWRIPWTEEPGRLQSMGSLGIRHD